MISVFLTLEILLNLHGLVLLQSSCPDGYWGDDCSSNCPANCFEGRCQQSSGKCFDCNAGFTDSLCDKRCGKNCVPLCSMEDGVCMDCEVGYYGLWCELACPSNCANNLCDKITGLCFDCEYRRFCGSSCSRECSSNCEGGQCSMDTCNCFSCIDGFGGLTCEKNVPENSRECTIAMIHTQLGLEPWESTCVSCNPGYYNPSTCADPCPLKCSGGKCHLVSGSCTDCMVGYYGAICDNECPQNCVAGCDFETGDCLACQIGFHGAKCEEQCGVDCSSLSCEQDSAQCTNCAAGKHGGLCNGVCPTGCANCIIGHYGANCDMACPSNCRLGCNRQTGMCNSCLSGYHGSSCTLTCGENCDFKGCEQDSGRCYDCEIGFHGDVCEKSCPKHCALFSIYDNNSHPNIQDNIMCSRNGECGMCVQGYHGYQCDLMCPDTCKYCDMETGRCRSCIGQQGYGDYCGGCVEMAGQSEICEEEKQCKKNTHCNGQGCLISDPEGPFPNCLMCKSGYHTSDCSRSCPGNCKLDTCAEDGSCITREDINFDTSLKYLPYKERCKHGYFGPSCIEKCPPSCGLLGCHADTGYCLDCLEKYFGEFCEVTCGYYCADCNVTSGECYACQLGYFGKKCDEHCYGFCKNGCNQVEGFCDAGCKAGFYGEYCNYTCPKHCFNDSCNQEYEFCTDGCDLNFIGEYCNETIVYVAQRSDGLPIQTLLPATMIPIFVICVMAVVAVFVYKHRQQIADAKQGDGTSDDISDLSSYLSSDALSQTEEYTQPQKEIPEMPYRRDRANSIVEAKKNRNNADKLDIPEMPRRRDRAHSIVEANKTRDNKERPEIPEMPRRRDRAHSIVDANKTRHIEENNNPLIDKNINRQKSVSLISLTSNDQVPGLTPAVDSQPMEYANKELPESSPQVHPQSPASGGSLEVVPNVKPHIPALKDPEITVVNKEEVIYESDDGSVEALKMSPDNWDSFMVDDMDPH